MTSLWSVNFQFKFYCLQTELTLNFVENKIEKHFKQILFSIYTNLNRIEFEITFFFQNKTELVRPIAFRPIPLQNDRQMADRQISSGLGNRPSSTHEGDISNYGSIYMDKVGLSLYLKGQI